MTVSEDFPDGDGENAVSQLGQGSQAEELPQLDGIDWEYALLHLKDMDILKETADAFYLAMDRESEELEQFFQRLQESSGKQQEKALEQFEIKVHAMKSNSAMIGAVPLSGVAKMLEYAARDKETEVLQAVTPVFLNEWKKMKVILGTYAAHARENEKADKIQADWSEVRRYTQQIVDAMKDMDIDTADEGMGQMKKYLYPEQMKPIVEKLSLAVTDIDVVRAEKWGAELAKMMDEMEGTEHEETR